MRGPCDQATAPQQKFLTIQLVSTLIPVDEYGGERVDDMFQVEVSQLLRDRKQRQQRGL